MPKTRSKAVVLVVSILFASTLSMFPQASQKPAAQSVSGGSEQSSNVKDHDIEMLRADLRAQRKQVTAQIMALTAEEEGMD